MPTYLEDITWAAMSDAGIDTDKVTRQHTETGDDIYVFIDGDLKIAFGPGAGEDADGGWDQVGQNWAQTVPELLDHVVQWVHS
jgi:hypothetical protein